MTLILVHVPAAPWLLRQRIIDYAKDCNVIHYGAAAPEVYKAGERIITEASELWHLPADDYYVGGYAADVCVVGVMIALSASAHYPKLIRSLTEAVNHDTDEYLRETGWEVI